MPPPPPSPSGTRDSPVRFSTFPFSTRVTGHNNNIIIIIIDRIGWFIRMYLHRTYILRHGEFRTATGPRWHGAGGGGGFGKKTRKTQVYTYIRLYAEYNIALVFRPFEHTNAFSPVTASGTPRLPNACTRDAPSPYYSCPGDKTLCRRLRTKNIFPS